MKYVFKKCCYFGVFGDAVVIESHSNEIRQPVMH